MKAKYIFSLLTIVPLLLSCSINGSSLTSSSLESTSNSQITSSLSTSNQSSTSSSSLSSSSSNSSSSSSSSSQVVAPDLPPISYVQVFAPFKYERVYAWQVLQDGKNKELVGKWPGTSLTMFDEKYKTYSFVGETELNLIFSYSNHQTKDLSVSKAGYYWFDEDKGDLLDHYPGSEDNQPDVPSGPIISCDSWKDFKFWNEYPKEHWKVINQYKGNRKDFRNESIYFAITTRFYDGDPSNNARCWDSKNNLPNDPEWRGDFKGLIEKLDYIKALGFTSIWITPVVKNASGYDYHGYHALNFNEVDERYLSSDVSFQDLINKAHEKDMKIILDVVFNHTGNFGEENLYPMFYKSGDLSSSDCLKMYDNSPLPSNYFDLPANEQYNARIAAMKNTKNDGSDPNHLYHHYGNFSWESFGEQVAQIAGDCVDLNTENPQVAEYLVKSYGNFIKMGVDAFRLDTVKHISRLTWNNYILPALYEYARRCGNDHFFMFGEVCTRVREVWNHGIPALSAPFFTWKEEKEYAWGDTETNLKSIEEAYEDNKSVSNERTSKNALLNNLEYHTPDYKNASGMGVIDFPMHWNFQYARDAFRVAKENDKYYNDATYNVMYVDSHDYGPDCISEVRYNMGTDAWAENMSLMFTFRGIPCIYYGSEIEFQKGKPIDKGPNLALADSGRAYYGDHLLGDVKASNFGEFEASGKVKETLSSPLAKHLIKLNKIRLNIPALRLGQYTTDNVDGEMAFIRRYTNDDVDSFALVSISNKATFNNIPNGRYVDVVSGDIKIVNNHSLRTSNISKGNARIYVLDNDPNVTLKQIGGSTTYLK